MSRTPHLYGRPLKDVRLERFCQEVAKGASPNVAANNAGFNTTDGDYGKHIMERSHIQDRIDEIRREIAAFAHPGAAESDEITLDDLTPEWVLREALATYTAAKAQNNVGVMVKMLDLIGRLKGIDKRPPGRPRVNKNPNEGDEKDESKPKPRDPIDFERLAKAVGDLRVGAGNSDEEEDSADDPEDFDDEVEEES